MLGSHVKSACSAERTRRKRICATREALLWNVQYPRVGEPEEYQRDQQRGTDAPPHHMY